MKHFAAMSAFLSGLTFLPGSGGALEASERSATAYKFRFELTDGTSLPLSNFRGKTILIVNTATACGFSNQFSGLQDLHERFKDRGLVVLGIPSNDFGGQEPRKNGEIAGYCQAKYGANFLLTAKTSVKGKSAHPFYKWAVAELGILARPYWNFHKYLIGPSGTLEAWFSSPTKPTSDRVISRIESLLPDNQPKAKF